MTNIYIAARLSRFQELKTFATKLTAAGHVVTSRWLYNNSLSGDQSSAHVFAMMDLEDVQAASIVIFIGEPRGSANRGGGRWFELGFAYHAGKQCIALLSDDIGNTDDPSLDVGHESVFTSLPGIITCFSQEEVFSALSLV